MPTATCETGAVRVWAILPIAAIGTLAPAGNSLQSAVDKRLEFAATAPLNPSYSDTGRTEHLAENRLSAIKEARELLKMKREDKLAALKEQQAEIDLALANQQPWEFFTSD